MVNHGIKKLVRYGLDTGLITEVDRIYAINQLLDVLGLDEYEEPGPIEEPVVLEEVLKELPPEKILDMIAKAWELAGIMVDEKG